MPTKKFKTTKDLKKALTAYFKSCTKKNPDGEMQQIRPYSVARLALHLNMSRSVFLRYCRGQADYMTNTLDKNGKKIKDEDGNLKKTNISFKDIMQQALTQIEAFNEECLFTSKNTDGPKFALKNNHRWRDQLDISGDEGGPIKLETITTQMTAEEAMKAYTDNIKASQNG